MTNNASVKTGVIILLCLVGLGSFFTEARPAKGRAIPTSRQRPDVAGDDARTAGGECTCRGPASTSNIYSKALYYRQLYCLTGYHLQILDDGKVSGTKQDHDIHAIMLIDSSGLGVITIKGVKSDYYLAMNKKGELYGRKDLSEECHFHEKLIENWYLTYSSHHHPKKKVGRPRKKEWFVGLDANGSPKKGRKAKAGHDMSHFRTKPVDPQKVPELYKDTDGGHVETPSRNVGSNTRCIPI
ncbi:fibroblast growth factor 20-like [Ptychodera flava]|uniref:fibroblast growth factor 20-like n=1 Tax=Ptychodera flava TaxID=63121 RepID=UPI003969E09E